MFNCRALLSTFLYCTALLAYQPSAYAEFTVVERDAEFKAYDQQRRDYFVRHFDTLKQQAKAGKGKELEAFAERLAGTLDADDFIKELQIRHYDDVFTDVDSGVEHLMWMAHHDVHDRSMFIYLPKKGSRCFKGVVDEPSELADLVRKVGSSHGSQGHCEWWTVRDGLEALADGMENYRANPNDKELDAHVYRHLVEYAMRMRDARLQKLLPHTVTHMHIFLPKKNRVCYDDIREIRDRHSAARAKSEQTRYFTRYMKGESKLRRYPGVAHQTSALYDIVKQVGSTNFANGGAERWTIKDPDALADALNGYNANPHHNRLDWYIYRHLKYYAKRIQHPRLLQLLHHRLRRLPEVRAKPASDRENRRFFRRHFKTLKIEAALGHGATLETFARQMTYPQYVEEFIAELQQRQYGKVFTRKRRGWRHLQWVKNSRVYRRSMSIALPQPGGSCHRTIKAEPSYLSDLLKRVGSTTDSIGNCLDWTIADPNAIAAGLANYKATNSALDVYIYQALQDYAHYIQHHRLIKALPHKVDAFTLYVPDTLGCSRLPGVPIQQQASPLKQLLYRAAWIEDGDSYCNKLIMKSAAAVQQALTHYDAHPADNDLDTYLYIQLQQYARRTDNKALLEALPHKVHW